MSVVVSTSVSSSASSSTMTLPLTSARPRMSIFTSDAERAARASKRHSVSKLYSMVQAEHDTEVEDDLSRTQKSLRDLKGKISAQSKKNFVLERDVRYLDSRIALLIQNRMALDEQNEFAARIEDAMDTNVGHFPDDRRVQQYGNLFHLLQAEPRHIATLCRLVTMQEIDSLLQTVMFTIYGNQYESREEHLLLTMFQMVLAHQFDETTDFANLLRQNTPVSRMMTTYTRRGPGQLYLKNILGNRINSLIEHSDLNLEINPLKIYEELAKLEEEKDPSGEIRPGVTAEEAAQNRNVQEAIPPRVAILMQLANSFLNTIIDSIDQVPYGIRWICKQIRSLTRRKYPDATELAVCTQIGGFFFLRYINPAIVTPQAYMLIDNCPEEQPRRTLTLIAKMLQNLANKPSYAKEPYMLHLAPFLDGNKTRMNAFLNRLCEVPDFYDTLEMDQYIALSKKDSKIQITLNEIYSTHSLLAKHLEQMTSENDPRLATILKDLGAAPAQLPRKENTTIELPLYSRFETPIAELTSSLDLTHEDILYMETKTLFVQLLRVLPSSISAVRPLDLPKVAESAAQIKDAVMVRKGIKAMANLRDLEDLNLVDSMDQYNPLAMEIEQELVHLGSQRTKAMDELKSLEGVYDTILEHNAYLRNQLSTYKQYLQNVRLASGGGDKIKGAGNTGFGVTSIGGKVRTKKPTKSQLLGPYKYSYSQLAKAGIICESNVPDSKYYPTSARANVSKNLVYFKISSPIPGTFIICFNHKEKSRTLLEIDLKLDDLLEMHQAQVQLLDLRFVQLDVPKLIALLNKAFARKKN